VLDKDLKFQLIKEALCEQEMAEYRRKLFLSEVLEKHILYELIDQKLLCEFDSRLPWMVVGSTGSSHLLYDRHTNTLFVRNPNMISKVKDFNEDECSRLDIDGLYFNSGILRSITKLHKKFHTCTTKIYCTNSQLIATIYKTNQATGIADSCSFSCMTSLISEDGFNSSNKHQNKKESSFPFREIIKNAGDASSFLKRDPHVEIAKDEEENDDHKTNVVPEEPADEKEESKQTDRIEAEACYTNDDSFYAAAPRYI
jgi:hypothetical protein